MDTSRTPSRRGDERTGGARRRLLKDKLEVVRITTPDGRPRWTVKPLSDDLSFEKGSFFVVRAIQALVARNRDVTFVGLAGPSGSGKTAFSEKIRSFMPGAAVISMDMYNDGSKVIDENFDDPRITDYETLLHNLADLREGKATDVPIYDFKQSRRVGYRTVEVPHSRVVIIEGIYALSRNLRPWLDLRVSITGGVHFDLLKRVLRDVGRSGQPAQAIIQQVSETVYPMYKAFIEPDLKTAQIRVQNSFNPFSGFMHPTFILKSDKDVPEDRIRRALGLPPAAPEAPGTAPGADDGGSPAAPGGDECAQRAPGGDEGAPRAVDAMEAAAGGPTAATEAAGVLFGDPEGAEGPPASPHQHLSATEQAGFTVAPRPLDEDAEVAGVATAARDGGSEGAESAAGGGDAPSGLPDESYDIYLVPPMEDVEGCGSWLRLRYRDGRYSLMFEEWVVDGAVIISPRVTFEVPVRILSGLMALGYELGAILRRTSRSFSGGRLAPGVTVKLDSIQGMPRRYVQVHGRDREAVVRVGRMLGLDGTYLPHSYIELVRMEDLSQTFQNVTRDLVRRFAIDGKPLVSEGSEGASGSLQGWSSALGSPSALSPQGSVAGGGDAGGGGLAAARRAAAGAGAGATRPGLAGLAAALDGDVEPDETARATPGGPLDSPSPGAWAGDAQGASRPLGPPTSSAATIPAAYYPRPFSTLDERPFSPNDPKVLGVSPSPPRAIDAAVASGRLATPHRRTGEGLSAPRSIRPPHSSGPRAPGGSRNGSRGSSRARSPDGEDDGARGGPIFLLSSSAPGDALAARMHAARQASGSGSALRGQSGSAGDLAKAAAAADADADAVPARADPEAAPAALATAAPAQPSAAAPPPAPRPGLLAAQLRGGSASDLVGLGAAAAPATAEPALARDFGGFPLSPEPVPRPVVTFRSPPRTPGVGRQRSESLGGGAASSSASPDRPAESRESLPEAALLRELLASNALLAAQVGRLSERLEVRDGVGASPGAFGARAAPWLLPAAAAAAGALVALGLARGGRT